MRRDRANSRSTSPPSPEPGRRPGSVAWTLHHPLPSSRAQAIARVHALGRAHARRELLAKRLLEAVAPVLAAAGLMVVPLDSRFDLAPALPLRVVLGSLAVALSALALSFLAWRELWSSPPERPLRAPLRAFDALLAAYASLAIAAAWCLGVLMSALLEGVSATGASAIGAGTWSTRTLGILVLLAAIARATMLLRERSVLHHPEATPRAERSR